MTNNRPLKKLWDKDYFTLIMWQSPDSKTYNKEWIGLPFFQWKKEFGVISPIVEQYCNGPVKIAEAWDILMSVRAPVWPTNLADQKCCIWRWLWAIRPNKQKCLIDYLLYFFKKFQTEISNLGKWSTFDAITKADLGNIPIPLPPLSTQKAIVAKLDEIFAQIDEAIATTQANIDQTDELTKSVLDKVFEEGEWERIKIGEKNIITLVMWQSPSSETYNRKWIWLPFFQWKKEFWEVYPVVEQYCSKPIKIAEAWDILMSVRAPVWPTNLADQKCCIWRWLWAIRPNKDKLITSYLLYFLKKFEKNITALWKGSTFSAITKSDLENVEIPIPPIAKQTEIVKYLDHVFAQSSQLKEQYQAKLVELRALKASVLQSAFEGKLV